MSQKKKKKNKDKSESTNKTKILLRLQKNQAISPETAKSLKEIGLLDKKKFIRHIELLESEGLIKSDNKGEQSKFWLVKDKFKPKKDKKQSSFLVIWFVSTFVLLFIFIMMFPPG